MATGGHFRRRSGANVGTALSPTSPIPQSLAPSSMYDSEKGSSSRNVRAALAGPPSAVSIQESYVRYKPPICTKHHIDGAAAWFNPEYGQDRTAD